ncbi:MAG: hypothetical protein IKI84_09350 [Clostridia bacterium]|nr:hypothetical protein [Clostridia bacterium]
MKWFTKAVTITAILALVVGIAGIVYAVHARMASAEYQFQIDAVLSAASIANEGKAVTDADRAVIAEYQGGRAVVVPGNYKALSYYLRMDAMMPPWGNVKEDQCLKITVCGEAVILVMPDKGSDDNILIRMTTGGKTFLMKAHGGNLWTNLLACAMQGTYHDSNIPLD